MKWHSFPVLYLCQFSFYTLLYMYVAPPYNSYFCEEARHISTQRCCHHFSYSKVVPILSVGQFVLEHQAGKRTASGACRKCPVWSGAPTTPWRPSCCAVPSRCPTPSLLLVHNSSYALFTSLLFHCL